MITIYYPRGFQAEREYVLEVLFEEFLGVKYELCPYDDKDYKVVLENKSTLFIKDSFFGEQKEDHYLKAENIPSQIPFAANNPFLVEKDIPIIFGDEELDVEVEQIKCGIDIFGSAFFMLTRWEEYVNKKRDLHHRFPAAESVAYKNKFLDRPIVNEYVEMLWKMLTYLRINQASRKRSFSIILTHDVDELAYWSGAKRSLQVLGADLLKRKDISLFWRNIGELFSVKTGRKKDPYDTIDYLLDLSENSDLKSHFYFMSGGITKFDSNYNIKGEAAIKMIEMIRQRGHIIGFHPSYAAFNNPKQWKMEKEILEQALGGPVNEGRQHYLRFEAPFTWNIWNDHGMTMDSTLGYADQEGFRCGTCYEYTVFDFINRRKLRLKENPLVVMEGTLYGYQSLTPNQMEDRIIKLMEVTKKYRGNFVFLWHNSSFNIDYWKKHDVVYKNIVHRSSELVGDVS